MRRDVWGAFLALMLAVTLPAAAADKVKVGVLNSSGDIGVFIARERGYFKDAGIELETSPFVSAAQMVAPLATGDLDVGGGVVSAGLYNAADRKINIRVVADRGSTAPGYRYQTLMIRKDLVDSGRYKGFVDLKGLKISVPAPGITPQAVIAEAARRGGIEYADIEQIFMGMSQQVVAFESKAIDGAIMIEPFATTLEKAGTAVHVALTEDIYPGAEISLVFYGEKFATERQEVAQRYMKAFLRGARDYNDAIDNGVWRDTEKARDVLRIYAKGVGMSETALRETRPQYSDPDGRVNLDALARDLVFFRKYGLVTSKTITADMIVDQSFAQGAVKELGPYRRQAP